MSTTDSSSTESRYVVVRREPHFLLQRRLWWIGALLGGLVGGGVIGYSLGNHLDDRVLAEAETLETTLSDTLAQLESTRGELAVHKHGSEVERQVSEHLRKEIVDLQNRLSEQERSIAFYKSILDPEKNQALAIHALELSQTSTIGRFSYKLVLIQPLDSDVEANGSVVITVSGVQSGKKKLLEWKSMSNGKPAPTFKFKVYQELVGELTLPDAFIPDTFSVRLVQAGSKAGEAREYPWTVKGTP